MHIIGIAKDSYTNDVQGGDHLQRFMQRRYGTGIWRVPHPLYLDRRLNQLFPVMCFREKSEAEVVKLEGKSCESVCGKK